MEIYPYRGLKGFRLNFQIRGLKQLDNAFLYKGKHYRVNGAGKQVDIFCLISLDILKIPMINIFCGAYTIIS